MHFSSVQANHTRVERNGKVMAKLYLDNNMRIDGKQSDERGGLFSEQKMNSIQNVKNLILLAAVESIDNHNQPRLLTTKRV